MSFVGMLRSLEIQSASTIALESMEHLMVFSKKHGFGKDFDSECVKLLDARPTAVVLYNAVQRIRRKKAPGEIRKIIKELENARQRVAANSSKVFLRKTTVMTHCHSTFEIAALVKNRKRIREVIVTETRPRNQGIRTARELLAKKIRVTFIVDAAISDEISRADIVMVGADALRKEGVVNKVGTHPMALVARENRKPFYVITSTFAVDRRKKFVMERRPPEEIVKIKGAAVDNPAFDITPWKYVTAVVTEDGILKPARIKRMIK
jgi:ribose 1,5-bisphosphate isomerase